MSWKAAPPASARHTQRILFILLTCVVVAEGIAATLAPVTWLGDRLTAIQRFPPLARTRVGRRIASVRDGLEPDAIWASSVNLVERFFRDLTTERLRRGVFRGVLELTAAIDEHVAHHKTNPKPFIWTKTARDILQKVICANSRLGSKQNATLHQRHDGNHAGLDDRESGRDEGSASM